MSDAERYWAVGIGVVGLVCLVAGSFLAALPAIDKPIASRVETLAARRSAVLTGSMLTATAGTLLIWPVAAIATYDRDTWTSLAMFSVGAAVAGAMVFFVAGLLTATAAWRDPADPAVSLLLDVSHLATWALSAPIGAALTVATTAAGVQAGVLGPVIVLLAAVKAVTVVVEIAGLGRREGWNAGGWAAGVSGYATAAWYAGLLFSLA